MRSRIEVVLPAPASGLRKKGEYDGLLLQPEFANSTAGPSAAKSAGKLKVLSSQKEF